MYLGVLQQIVADYDEQLQPPCNPQELKDLVSRSRVRLGYECCPQYLHFLSIANGLNWNGVTIYASETSSSVGAPALTIRGFVEGNERYRFDRPGCYMEDYVIFGDDGVVNFVYHIPSGEFQAITMAGMTTCTTYGSFDEMVEDAIRARIPTM